MSGGRSGHTSRLFRQSVPYPVVPGRSGCYVGRPVPAVPAVEGPWWDGGLTAGTVVELLSEAGGGVGGIVGLWARVLGRSAGSVMGLQPLFPVLWAEDGLASWTVVVPIEDRLLIAALGALRSEHPHLPAFLCHRRQVAVGFWSVTHSQRSNRSRGSEAGARQVARRSTVAEGCP